jgi:hypothetical protein
MSLLGLVVGVLGVWRITHLLHAENGPGDLIVWLRRRMGQSVIGRAIGCFDCLSLWIAMPFAVAVARSWLDRALVWPALAAGAMIVHRAVIRLERQPAAMYIEDPPEELTDVQLRQQEGDVPGSEPIEGERGASTAADGSRPSSPDDAVRVRR